MNKNKKKKAKDWILGTILTIWLIFGMCFSVWACYFALTYKGGEESEREQIYKE